MRAKSARALEAEESDKNVAPLLTRSVNSRSSSSTVTSSSTSSRRKSVEKTSRCSSPAAKKAKKGRGSAGRRSGTQTPLSRASRSSSVASNSSKKHHQVSSTSNNKSAKAKKSRGYNPNLVNYKESEYHYGSDFEDDDDEFEEQENNFRRRGHDSDDDKTDSDSDDSSSENHRDDDDDDYKVESDVDLDSTSIIAAALDERSESLPFFLRRRDDAEIPELKLPDSSEDLLAPRKFVLRIFAVYEVFRRFHQILRLTPFRVEDFCAALSSEEQSNLLSEIHVALLKTLQRAEESNGTAFGPLETKDSVNCIFFFVDSVTWPETLRQFLQCDPNAQEEIFPLLDKSEYPFKGDLEDKDEMIERRLKVLTYLTDQILFTQSMRDFITEDGHQSNEEHCRVCHRLGEMLVCDTCSGVYHLGCLDPPLEEVPEEEWRCYVCLNNEVDGVCFYSDKSSDKSAQRQKSLGRDRLGNRYWFTCRRLIVENDGDEDAPEIRYSSDKTPN